MPPKSKAQLRLMEAAAHTPGGYGGVPQSVGREFTSGLGKGAGKKLPARVSRAKGKSNKRGILG